MGKFSEKTSKLNHIGKYRDGRPRTEKEKQKSRELKRTSNDLRRTANKSIYTCSFCHEYDNDMGFFPFFSEWFCIEYYTAHHNGWMESTKIGKEQADLLEKRK